MASKLSMEPSSVKGTSNILDRYPQRFRTPSSELTCKANTATPSSLYALPVLPNRYPFRPSVQSLLSIESVNKQLENLLKIKLIHLVSNGRPSETFEFHCSKLIEEVHVCLQPYYSSNNMHDTCYRDQLMSLLASTSKQNTKNIPLDESEWLKLLHQWIRNSSADDIIFSRNIYQIMAVDGFSGFRPKDLKLYLPIILIPLTSNFIMHAKGVRAMYEFFNQTDSISSLTGTDSACVIFLSLLNLYVEQLQFELLDDQVHFQIQQAKSWVEGFLYKHSDYYKDINKADETVLKTLATVYSDHFIDKNVIKIVGRDLLKGLHLLCSQLFN